MVSWFDSRHPMEREADARIAAARAGRAVEAPAEIAAVTSSEAIEGAADRLVAARVLSAVAREKRVPLELKGLKANMMKLQGRVERLNGLAIAADEKGATLEDHLGAIGSQLGAHVDDIEFAANVLGNSDGSSKG